MRSVYWFLCGASATLLTSAWATRQVEALSPNQDITLEKVVQQENTGLSHPENIHSLLMRSPWTEAKSNPFLRTEPVEAQSVLSISEKSVESQSHGFSYVFIGKLLADEGNMVFLSKNKQIISAVQGEILDGEYRIESIGKDSLELTYLPERKRMTLSFSTFAASPSPVPTRLAQAEVPPVVQKTIPGAMIGEVPSEENGQMTESLKQLLAPAPPPQGDALKMMGVTPPPQGDAVQLMSAPQVPSDGVSNTSPQGLPGMPASGNTLVVPSAMPAQMGQ